MITFDDVSETIYDEGYSYMQPRGIKGTCYLVTDLTGTPGYVTWAEAVTMDAAGWDMGNHSKTHPHFTTLTQAQIETELTGAQAALEAQGLTRASRHVAYPYGDRDADSDAAMIAAGMLTGRLALGGSFNYWELADLKQVPVNMQCIATTTLDQVTTQINNARRASQACIILIHVLKASPTGSEWSIANFQGLIDFLVANEIPTLTISELYALMI